MKDLPLQQDAAAPSHVAVKNQLSITPGREVSGRTRIKRKQGRFERAPSHHPAQSKHAAYWRPSSKAWLHWDLSSSILIQGKFSPRSCLMLRFPPMTSSRFFVQNLVSRRQNYDIHSCHRESAQSQYQTPTLISSSGTCEQTQHREYELICTTGNSLKICISAFICCSFAFI